MIEVIRMRIRINNVSIADVIRIVEILAREHDDVYIEVNYDKNTNTYHTTLVIRDENEFVQIQNFLYDYKYRKEKENEVR